jgi:dUTP pyrophosphatase
MQLKIKKLNSEAVLPNYSYEDDAAFDLFSTETLEIKHNDRIQVPTGIAMQIPVGYVGLIWDKSGLSHKHGLKTLGGVVDSGYRGEVQVGLINLSNENYKIEKGHKVAQMIIQKKETCEIVEVDELEESERGEGGFGSSGK